MTDEEAHAARALWDELHAQYEKCSARNRRLAENETAPDWQELDKKATRSDLKFGRLRNTLAEYCDVPVDVLCSLLPRPAGSAGSEGTG